ncbi:hypothetical protein LTR05_005319 [Lithohypha guttulata]|uniref:Myb-like domain-containing protein n=1 Tax=Lithohypha guttulata TaxID=1690604 RepID=A0AAN7SXK6_9EURO|nr:hypothetical protein LTR05_005319 [Lithohypha guttulata]
MRPRKRPRLYFHDSATPEPDAELEHARQRNDDLLKSRWENIFRKYGRDFTGIADEIGVISGEVEIDNGHIQSMQYEWETSEEQNVNSSFDGKRMLRAMTEVNSEGSTPVSVEDEVLESIETIAGVAMLSDVSSEDSLFLTESRALSLEHDELSQEYYEERHGTASSHGTNDLENLPLQPRTARSPSPDDLFDTQRDSSAAQRTSSLTVSEFETPPTPAPAASIYKSTIRAEVRRILEEERGHQMEMEEEMIEPAWRIPVRLPSSSRLLPRIVSTERSPSEWENETTSALDPSSWAGLSRAQQSKRQAVRPQKRRRFRDESEDPLQEGFSSEPETQSRAVSRDRSAQSPSTSAYFEAQLRQRSETQTTSRQSSRQMSSTPWPIESERPDPASLSRKVWNMDDAVATVETRTAYHVDYGSHRRDMHSAVTPRHNEAAVPDWSPEEESDNDGWIYDQEPNPSSINRRSRYLSEQPDPQSVLGDMSVEYAGKFTLDTQKRRSSRRSAPHLRFTAPESSQDKSNHPWQQPVTRSGKPLGKKSLKQRKVNSVKFVESATSLNETLAEPSYVEQCPNPDDPVVKEIERQKVFKPMNEGICYYCNGNHLDKNGVGAHWDRVLTNFAVRTLDDEDPHDIEFIHAVRSKVERRTRPAKTCVADFKAMIQLHEGSGMSFKDIVASHLLITTKGADRLQSEYDVYRQPAQTPRQWTTEEVDKLKELVNRHLTTGNKQITIISLYRQSKLPKTVTFVDLGNKLAEIFLEEYATSGEQFIEELRTYRSRSWRSNPTDGEGQAGASVVDPALTDTIKKESTQEPVVTSHAIEIAVQDDQAT